MSHQSAFDRRTFIKSAGAAAAAGALGASPVIGEDLSNGPSVLLQDAVDFDAVYDRVGTDSIKWDRAIRDYGPGVEVGMGIADMDFRAAPCITRALAERCEHENWGYLHRPAAYTQAIVDWHRRRDGIEVDPATIVWITGVHAGIIAAVKTFSPPGMGVLMNTPTYNGFYSDLRFARALPEDNQMIKTDGRYSIDWEDFERRAQRVNLFILCNPQNPTGNCWSPEDLMRMGEICLRHKVIVLADEIHCQFVTRGNKHTPFSSLPDKDIVDNSITFNAASKTFNIAAMKVGWYFSTNPDLLARISANTRRDITTLGLVANHAALTEGEPWIDQLLPYIDANHDYVSERIGHVPMIRYTKPQGTFLAWLDVRELAEAVGAQETARRLSATAVNPVSPEMVMQRWFAENAGVFFQPGREYGTGGEGHMRMNIGTSRRLVAKALDNMQAAIERL